MTSKPSATNCPRLSRVWLMFSVVWYCLSCSALNTDGYVIRSLLVAIGHLYLRTVLVLPVQGCFLWCAAKDKSGGYCGGVPPLPIPNREVKPTCADGTAMQCGRVGSCLFSYQRPWREISEVFFVLSGLSCCPCTDGTPCQIGQCGRVGSRLFCLHDLRR